MTETERRQRSISSTPRLNPEEVANRSFATSFRGFAEQEVRAFLKRISDELAALRGREQELVAAVDDLEERLRAPRPLDERELLDALGDETARLLHSAREAADDIRVKAQERAARLVEEATDEARRLREEVAEHVDRRTREVEEMVAEMLRDAEARAEELRADMEQHVSERRRHTDEECERDLEAARAEGRELVEEAKALRERVLADLARRRNFVGAQLEELRTGRDRLLDVYRVVKRTFLEATEALAHVEAEAAAGRDPVPEVPGVDEPDATATPDAGPEPSAATVPTGTGEEPDERDKPSLSDVDTLFARIRAGRTEADVSLAAEERAEGAVAPPTREPGDDAWRARRRGALEPLRSAAVRAAKRAAQDEQNTLLDAVRRLKGRAPAGALLPDADAQAAAWGALLAPGVGGAYAAGRAAADGDEAPTPDDAARDAVLLVAGPLRERIVQVLDDTSTANGSADASDLVERVGARYREWRNEAVDQLVDDALAAAWARGVYDAAADDAVLQWVTPDGGCCADCDDNALEPTSKGAEFPTGQRRPPAHPGCRCLLVAFGVVAPSVAGRDAG
jgi:DivIVA domain-containing protein